MESRVEKRHSAVYAEIKLLTESYIAEIQKRGKALLGRLDTIHNVKMAALAHQKRELMTTTACLAQVSSIFSTIPRGPILQQPKLFCIKLFGLRH
jgi:hypothetical protein